MGSKKLIDLNEFIQRLAHNFDMQDTLDVLPCHIIDIARQCEVVTTDSIATLEIEKVKKALDICAHYKKCFDSNCPYIGHENCQRVLARDTLEVIVNLEERIAIMEEGRNGSM